MPSSNSAQRMAKAVSASMNQFCTSTLHKHGILCNDPVNQCCGRRRTEDEQRLVLSLAQAKF